MIDESFLLNENEEFGEQLLEDFTILQKLGTGAFSKVYKVLYQDQIYALKVVDKQLATGNNIVEKLNQEAYILNTLEHPNIVQYYKTIESKRKLYFLIEYIEGKSLQEYIDKSLNESQIRQILQQIIYAVAYIHKKGIIHRDLKPDNILVDKEWNVKIIDFGLSFQTINSTTHETCGTLIYMAPEALMKKEYFKSVDIWSLGIIQYMMFAICHPFWTDDTRETFLRKMKTPQQVCYPQNMSKAAISFFEKTAAWEPEARLTAEQALIHPWISGVNSQMPMSSKDIIQTFKCQNQFHQVLFCLSIIQKVSQKRDVIQTQQLRAHSQFQNNLHPLIVSSRNPSSQQKLKTESQQQQPPLSAHRTTLSRMQNNSSFLSFQDVFLSYKQQPREDVRLKQMKNKQQQFKLPPINTKSANNSPQNSKSTQMFTFSPYKKAQPIGELKKSQFKL
ncbi:unnamed protein product (macronuclear) [Paramecium tetraurelia]|uniref:Protein kinase domain-containing protein n=1 Tax=Paramecium tetraurelia TaxID=5888 RepID=A0CGD8_PARTE|nr:uncharacterized protein GSPATT00007295001 [Paramecium tetraurelia]CAK69855.1 unnamed protein product [Paramecium tetraurelia]|eukprot:XP_001437252.1 hypothetical protein (macronuclear) [Paramecium tetraurelia strain d4-2]